MAAIVDAIQTLRLIPFHMTRDPEAYIDKNFFGFLPSYGYEVVRMMERKEMSFQTCIWTLCVLDRSDTDRRRMIGTKKIGSEHMHCTIKTRRMCQRWFRETERGRAEHLDNLYNAISTDPGAFLSLIAPPKKGLLQRLRRKSKKPKRT